MNKLLKKYWYNRLLIPLIILCGGIDNAAAQNSFFIKIPTWSGYFPEVFEDEKGCIIAKYDFGLTRITPDGRILWQTGDYSLVKGACVKDSQSYIFPALDSEMGGFRIQSIDYKGKMVWIERENFTEKRLRTINDFIIDSARKQYIVAGDRGKVGDINNVYYWIAGLDYRGHILWERDWRDSGASRNVIKILKNKKTGGYMLLTQDVKDQFRKELFNVDTLGNLINRNFPEPKICKGEPYDTYRISVEGFCEFRDGFIGIIGLSITSPCTKIESGAYFYIYDYNGKVVERKGMTEETEIGVISQLPNGDILGMFWDSILRTGVKVLSNKLETKWKTLIPNLPTSDVITGYHLTYSNDGGYIGIVSETDFLTNEYFVYVFKTDSLGNIKPTIEYTEKQRPVMLQPNPASNKVRIAIPYYFGKVTAGFYTMQGVFLFEKTKDEQNMFDISSLSSGMYIVKARIEETGEKRTMKLVVE